MLMSLLKIGLLSLTPFTTWAVNDNGARSIDDRAPLINRAVDTSSLGLSDTPLYPEIRTLKSNYLDIFQYVYNGTNVNNLFNSLLNSYDTYENLPINLYGESSNFDGKVKYFHFKGYGFKLWNGEDNPDAPWYGYKVFYGKTYNNQDQPLIWFENDFDIHFYEGLGLLYNDYRVEYKIVELSHLRSKSGWLAIAYCDFFDYFYNDLNIDFTFSNTINRYGNLGVSDPFATNNNQLAYFNMDRQRLYSDLDPTTFGDNYVYVYVFNGYFSTYDNRYWTGIRLSYVAGNSYIEKEPVYITFGSQTFLKEPGIIRDWALDVEGSPIFLNSNHLIFKNLEYCDLRGNWKIIQFNGGSQRVYDPVIVDDHIVDPYQHFSNITSNDYFWHIDSYKFLHFYSVDASFVPYMDYPLSSSSDTLYSNHAIYGSDLTFVDNLTLLNNGSIGSSITEGTFFTYLGTTYAIIGNGFQGIFKIMGTNILPGVSIGAFVLVPLILTLIILCVRLVKK